MEAVNFGPAIKKEGTYLCTKTPLGILCGSLSYIAVPTEPCHLFYKGGGSSVSAYQWSRCRAPRCA